jgi:hypothetical protein
MSALQMLPEDRAMRDRMLFPGKVLRIACSRPGLLTARHGALWLTFEQVAAPDRWSPDDHFLTPGQSIQLRPGDVVVASASDARYGLSAFDWLPGRLVRVPVPSRWQVMVQAFARLAGAGGALPA